MIAVIGAGMVGCATALALRERGYEVTVFEKRNDPRSAEQTDVGRSINLAISARGLNSLNQIDSQLGKEVLECTVPMRGRMLHLLSPETSDSLLSEVPYGIHGTESINSISRSKLNNIMISHAEKSGAVFKFGFDTPKNYDDLVKLGTPVFGCDGTFSVSRDCLMRKVNYKLEMEVVPTYYLEIPVNSAPQWSPNHLHIWPRGEHMFIALPNDDNTFTGTLFASNDLLKSLEAPGALANWFAVQFPDAYDVIGEDMMAKIGTNAPRGKLTSLKFQPYNFENKLILLGDASHSMVPFYGQGLNAGLEDVFTLFSKFIKTRPISEWEVCFNEYSKFRKPDLDAINDLSMENYLEMSSKVTTLKFRLRKRLDNWLARFWGDKWLPLYTMVSFRSDVRYSDALQTSRLQDKVLNTAMNLGAGATFIGVLAAIYKLKVRK